METKSSHRETSFAPGTSRNREQPVTLRLIMARDEVKLLEMGERIRELRESHGYKQEWIADQVGVKLRTYQFWQQGKHPPEQDSLEKLAQLFGVTPRYILKGETPDLLGGGQDVIARLERIEQRFSILERIEAQLTTLTEMVEQLALAEAEALLASEQAAQRARQTAAARGRRRAS